VLVVHCEVDEDERLLGSLESGVSVSLSPSSSSPLDMQIGPTQFPGGQPIRGGKQPPPCKQESPKQSPPRPHSSPWQVPPRVQ
jgi:hypothetical protein